MQVQCYDFLQSFFESMTSVIKLSLQEDDVTTVAGLDLLCACCVLPLGSVPEMNMG